MNSLMSKPDPCPFCGNRGVTAHKVLTGSSRWDGQYFFMECDRCRAGGPRAATEEEARSIWNGRVSLGCGRYGDVKTITVTADEVELLSKAFFFTCAQAERAFHVLLRKGNHDPATTEAMDILNDGSFVTEATGLLIGLHERLEQA